MIIGTEKILSLPLLFIKKIVEISAFFFGDIPESETTFSWVIRVILKEKYGKIFNVGFTGFI